MNKEILNVKDLAVKKQNREILENINISVKEGEFIGIIGANGAGKSTLLRSLANQEKDFSGTVKLFNKDISLYKEKEFAKHVAYMQQDLQISFGYSVLDIVLMGRYPYLAWWQHEQKEDKEIAAKYLEFADVEELKDRKINQVSGGERKRVLLAKILTQETKIIYLDEPISDLDLSYQEEVFNYLHSICKLGKTILVVVHDLEIAAKFCSRLILLNKGSIIADGTPAEVITKEYLRKAFNLDSIVYPNKITGDLAIHTYLKKNFQINKKVHLIGSGDTLSGLVNVLYELGCSLSAGVIFEDTIDYLVLKAFQIDCLKEISAEISAEMSRQNIEKIQAADLTVLGNLKFTMQNISNLKDAFQAKKLIIIEDDDIENRDFTNGEAVKLYRDLVARDNVEVWNLKKFLIKIEHFLQNT
ncbi:ABC transporter ATP-binding protein [Selenomonadales bacterium OttesenSCG-928-I06]|nr:ABC transporter ATP-binding protein [Selenomonadales bacterium OttesenSCG-928-I06]